MDQIIPLLLYASKLFFFFFSQLQNCDVKLGENSSFFYIV